MINHTPGPWEAVADPGHFHTLSTVHGGPVKTGAGPSQPLIAQVGGMARPDEQSANTRLIAAAPELLEELQYRYEQNRCGCGHPVCKFCEDDRHTLEVLRKAKGETG